MGNGDWRTKGKSWNSTLYLFCSRWSLDPAKRARLEVDAGQKDYAEAELPTSTTMMDAIPDGLLADIFQYFHFIERRQRRRVSIRWNALLRSRSLLSQVAIDIDPRFKHSLGTIVARKDRRRLIDSDNTKTVLFYSSSERNVVGETTPQTTQTVLDRDRIVEGNTLIISELMGILWRRNLDVYPPRVLLGKMDVSIRELMCVTSYYEVDARPRLFVHNIRVPALDDHSFFMENTHFVGEAIRCTTMIDVSGCGNLDWPNQMPELKSTLFNRECKAIVWTMLKKYMKPLTTPVSYTAAAITGHSDWKST